MVGIGPGSIQRMTKEAEQVLGQVQLIVGYSVYVDLIKENFSNKEFYTTPMRQEKERCLYALEKAENGITTAVICSGDGGIYGLSGLLHELAVDFHKVEIKVIPGVTAAISGGAVLGAPIGHDFAVISLSDLLTPWEKIEKRLKAAAEGDFIVCIYNPSSHKRKDYLQKACDILLQYKPENTVCGYVRNIGRDGEEAATCSLLQLRDQQVDMFTTVYIGNIQTKEIGTKMVTPRGYEV